MIKYSIGVFFEVWTNNRNDWLKQIRFIEKLSGVEHIELMLENVELNKADLNYLKSLLSNYKLIMHAPFMNLSLLSPHEEIVEASINVYRKAAEIAKKLKASIVTLHLDTYPHYYSEEDAKAETKKFISNLYKQIKLKIAIENISYTGKTLTSYPHHPNQLYELDNFRNSEIGFTIDTGHFLLDGHDPIKVIKTLKNRIFDIHLHDGSPGKAHLELGKGDLNLDLLIKTLRDIDYMSYLSLEVMGQREIISSWKILKETINKYSC